MKPWRGKGVLFLLIGLNSFSVTLYLYYIFFFLQAGFGFTGLQNLLVAASVGLIYIPASLYGGAYGQKQGYRRALIVGLSIMSAMLIAGTMTHSRGIHLVVLGVYTVGTCFTWPALEASVSDHAPSRQLQGIVGLYNLTWALTGALAYFLGGAMLEWLGLKSIFWFPLTIHGLELALVLRLGSTRNEGLDPTPGPTGVPATVMELNPRPIAKVRMFLRLAWLANPLAYVAINTVIPGIPTLAKRLELSPKLAGFVCSIWLFMRAATFLGLWQWRGWHYHFGWLAAAYGALVASYVWLLQPGGVAGLVAAQMIFGCAIGLIYYSSLYYSMDAGEEKGERGGIHEAAIGVGNFMGPAIAASAQGMFPRETDGSPGVWAVGLVLGLGCIGLAGIRWRNWIAPRAGHKP